MGRKKEKKTLLGISFDKNEEEQLRITHGDNFQLYGGSKYSHEEMQEKAAQFNEELKKKNKSMDNISNEEFCEIADKLDMPLIEKPAPKLFSRN